MIPPGTASIAESSPVDESSGRLSVRPHREFAADRGKERMLSLRILNEFQPHADLDYLEPASSTSVGAPRNAYDFMTRRREDQGGDPALRLWKASIRAQNFGGFNAPLCVSAAGSGRRAFN